MPVEYKKAHEPADCGINLYADSGSGRAEGPWRATEAEARADRKAVETAALEDAAANAKAEAKKVARRRCPKNKNCGEKSGTEDPIQPILYEADLYDTAPTRDLANGWQWVAKASAPYEVQFVCS